ncbi:unnamed protein product [Cercospora beticola]|nr:unnamed protein product [Cercospora beticola]
MLASTPWRSLLSPTCAGEAPRSSSDSKDEQSKGVWIAHCTSAHDELAGSLVGVRRALWAGRATAPDDCTNATAVVGFAARKAAMSAARVANGQLPNAENRVE